MRYARLSAWVDGAEYNDTARGFTVLPKRVRAVVQTGAAIGRELSYQLLRAVSLLPEDELRSALGRLVDS
jgi:hypothetical protein